VVNKRRKRVSRTGIDNVTHCEMGDINVLTFMRLDYDHKLTSQVISHRGKIRKNVGFSNVTLV